MFFLWVIWLGVYFAIKSYKIEKLKVRSEIPLPPSIILWCLESGYIMIFKKLHFLFILIFSLSLSNCLLYFAVIHVAAHYFNFERLLESHSADNIKGILSRWPTSPNGSWVNPIRTANTVNFYANFSKLPWLIFKGQIIEKW